MKRLAVLVSIACLAGCANSTPDETTEAPPAKVQPAPGTKPPVVTASVPWNDYGPGLQARVDQMAASKDCMNLQAEFNNADTNSDATRARTGHSNVDLMEYIDSALRAAGCY